MHFKLFLLLIVLKCTCCNYITGKKNLPPATKLFVQDGVTIQKVTLTQRRGYLQFLKYNTSVPAIEDFTTCIWLKSDNYSLPHNILSYTKGDEFSFLQIWIENGQHIKMEMLDNPIFSVPVVLKEYQWYHICVTWNSPAALWGLFLNGKLLSSRNYFKLQNVKIPPNGAIVVGQDYTNINKGTEDGIEGDIYGFNIILAPALRPLRRVTHGGSSQHSPAGAPATSSMPASSNLLNSASPPSHGYEVREEDLFDSQTTTDRLDMSESEFISSLMQPTRSNPDDIPEVLGYFENIPNREGRGLLDFFKNIYSGLTSQTQVVPIRVNYPSLNPIRINYRNSIDGYRNNLPTTYHHQHQNQHYQKDFYFQHPVGKLNMKQRIFNDMFGMESSGKRIYNEAVNANVGGDKLDGGGAAEMAKPLGLALVELGYGNCALGKGAPVKGGKVLIDWTQTPVMVFGGAILKNTRPFCKKN